jgi:hypothetical protein
MDAHLARRLLSIKGQNEESILYLKIAHGVGIVGWISAYH